MEKNTTYLVVETHSAYAVVLDSGGRFIKTANPGYTVGDTTDRIVPLIYPQDRKHKRNAVIRLAASLAACICLCAFGIFEYQYMFAEYGNVHMQINPEVEISLSRSGRVLDVEGENADGNALLENYDYKGKDKETVVDELTDRAIEQDYLAEDGQISLFVDARSSSWASRVEQELLDELNRHLQDHDIVVEITVGSPAGAPETDESLQILDEPQKVTIPIRPADGEDSEDDAKADAPAPSDDSPYESRDDGMTDYAEPAASPSSPAVPSAPTGNDSGYDSGSPYNDDNSESNSGDSAYESVGNSPYEENGDSSYDDSGSSSPYDDD